MSAAKPSTVEAALALAKSIRGQVILNPDKYMKGPGITMGPGNTSVIYDISKLGENSSVVCPNLTMSKVYLPVGSPRDKDNRMWNQNTRPLSGTPDGKSLLLVFYRTVGSDTRDICHYSLVASAENGSWQTPIRVWRYEDKTLHVEDDFNFGIWLGRIQGSNALETIRYAVRVLLDNKIPLEHTPTITYPSHMEHMAHIEQLRQNRLRGRQNNMPASAPPAISSDDSFKEVAETIEDPFV